jgi:hypothetical protein
LQGGGAGNIEVTEPTLRPVAAVVPVMLSWLRVTGPLALRRPPMERSPPTLDFAAEQGVGADIEGLAGGAEVGANLAELSQIVGGQVLDDGFGRSRLRFLGLRIKISAKCTRHEQGSKQGRDARDGRGTGAEAVPSAGAGIRLWGLGALSHGEVPLRSHIVYRLRSVLVHKDKRIANAARIGQDYDQ